MTSKERRAKALGKVLELVVLLEEDMSRALARDGLTKSRAPLVWHLHQKGPSTQRALADAMGTTPRNITGLVDGLAATGFVTREPHPTDRRATLVALTEHGRAVMDRMAAEADDLAEQFFGEMSQRRLDGFLAGLDAVLGVIHRHLELGPGAREERP